MPPHDKKHYNDRRRKEVPGSYQPFSVAPYSANLQKDVITITKQQVESQWLFVVAVKSVALQSVSGKQGEKEGEKQVY